MSAYIVTTKWGQRHRIQATDLRAAQDKALAIFGPWVVILVQEARP